MPCTEDNGDVVSYGQELPSKMQAGELWHSLIEDDEIEAGWIRREEIERLGTVSHGIHGITETFECSLSPFHDRLLIVNKEYPLRPRG